MILYIFLPIAVQLEGEPEYYVANYPYQSQEPGDLTFNAGDLIAVYKKDGDWWTGKLNDNTGIFPSNYVQKVDVSHFFYLCLNLCFVIWF